MNDCIYPFVYLSIFLFDHVSIMHGFTNIEFLCMLGTVLDAGDTLVKEDRQETLLSWGLYSTWEGDNKEITKMYS